MEWHRDYGQKGRLLYRQSLVELVEQCDAEELVSKAFAAGGGNPNHKGTGPGGGQFTTAEGHVINADAPINEGVINRFRDRTKERPNGGDYYWLSDSYANPAKFDGVVYPTAEAAFQASKATKASGAREKILEIATRLKGPAGTASMKALTNKLPEADRNPDYDAQKLSIREAILRDKIERNPEFKKQLLATAGKDIIEGPNRGPDKFNRFWGASADGTVGDNNLGKMLMGLRDEYSGGKKFGSSSAAKEAPGQVPVSEVPASVKARLQPGIVFKQGEGYSKGYKLIPEAAVVAKAAGLGVNSEVATADKAEILAWAKKNGVETRGGGRGISGLERASAYAATFGATLGKHSVTVAPAGSPEQSFASNLATTGAKALIAGQAAYWNADGKNAKGLNAAERDALKGYAVSSNAINDALKTGEIGVRAKKDLPLIKSALEKAPVMDTPVTVYRGLALIDNRDRDKITNVTKLGREDARFVKALDGAEVGPGGSLTKVGVSQRREIAAQQVQARFNGVSVKIPSTVQSTSLDPNAAAAFALPEIRVPVKKGGAVGNTSGANFGDSAGYVMEIEAYKGAYIAPGLRGVTTKAGGIGAAAGSGERVPLEPQQEVVLPVGSRYEIVSITKGVKFRPGKYADQKASREFTVVKVRQILPQGTIPTGVHGQRLVRTPEGAKLYGVPIGSVIKVDDNERLVK